MPKTVILVGHCGPDSSHLRYAVSKASKDVRIVAVEDQSELSKELQHGADLILFNRELGWGYEDKLGADAIARLRAAYPNQKMMLVSNYPDAQAQAVANGALPGFGKREIGQARVNELLREALGEAVAKPQSPAKA